MFHNLPLKKSGWNDYSKYSYFELKDFLQPALDIFNQNGLCAVISFEKDLATMTIIDVDVDQPMIDNKIVITSPMGSANLKACHEVQNIGAVETYQRRYLWITALEILENDSIESDSLPESLSLKTIQKLNNQVSQASSLEELKTAWEIGNREYLNARQDNTEFKNLVNAKKAELSEQ